MALCDYDAFVKRSVPMVSTARIRAIPLVLIAAGSLSAQGSLEQESGRVVVLPDSAMPHVLTQCSRGAPRGVSGFWRPTPADVAAAEDAIDRALARALDSVIARDGVGETEWLKRPRAGWPDQYYRQYAGLRYRDGRRTLYVNGLAAGWPRELSERVPQHEATNSHPFANPDWWRSNVATVCDGGESFFGAEYDRSSKRVISFQFNRRG
jgi:hypothetical protein